MVNKKEKYLGAFVDIEVIDFKDFYPKIMLELSLTNLENEYIKLINLKKEYKRKIDKIDR